jgi:hypothetical protein
MDQAAEFRSNSPRLPFSYHKTLVSAKPDWSLMDIIKGSYEPPGLQIHVLARGGVEADALTEGETKCDFH